MIDEDGDRAREQVTDYLRGIGPTRTRWRRTVHRGHRAVLAGDPDEVAADLQARVLDQGVDGLVINLPVSGPAEVTVELAGRRLRKLVST